MADIKGFTVAENKKAYHDYFIEETLECGISLNGNEVKSLREKKCSIKEAWITVQNGNLVVRGMHISKWGTSNAFDLLDEKRERQLLAHNREIAKLQIAVKQDGYTLVPLKIYFLDGRKCKVLVGLAKGKHTYDKRNDLKEKQVTMDISRALKGANK